jgi:hypothetical protein
MNGTAKTTSGKVKVFNAYQGADAGFLIPANTVFQWTEKKANWLKMTDGNWINCGATFQYAQILTYPTTTPPPPPVDPPPANAPKLTNIIDVFNDGTIDVKPQ